MKTTIDLSLGTTTNPPYGFRDIDTEYTRYPCEIVSGEIPSILFDGNYYKQSGAAFKELKTTNNDKKEEEESIQFLDGLAGIVSFHFVNSKQVLFSNCILKQVTSNKFIKTKGKQRQWVVTANTSSDKPSVFERLSEYFFPNNNLYSSINPNVVIWKFINNKNNNDVVLGAATEANGDVLLFNKYDLNTLGPLKTITPNLKREMVITTCAHYDDKTGYHVSLLMRSEGFFPPSFTFSYCIHKGNTTNQPFQFIAQYEIAKFSYLDRNNQPVNNRPAYMHCYAITNNYLILLLSKMRLNYNKLLSYDFSNGFFGLFDSIDDLPTQYLLFDLNKQQFVTNKLYQDNQTSIHLWHLSNSFEVDDRIIIDASSAKQVKFDDKSSQLVRIEINLTTNQVTTKPIVSNNLNDLQLEFPQINPLFINNPKYNYIYALNQPGNMYGKGGLVQINIKSGEVINKVLFQSKLLLSEPIFVPNNASNELDGFVLITATDIEANESFMLILNPQDGLTEVCRIKSPLAINAGLHSHYYSKI
jgi:carotenoid cleavage dioxygenase-like enzyme